MLDFDQLLLIIECKAYEDQTKNFPIVLPEFVIEDLFGTVDQLNAIGHQLHTREGGIHEIISWKQVESMRDRIEKQEEEVFKMKSVIKAITEYLCKFPDKEINSTKLLKLIEIATRS